MCSLPRHLYMALIIIVVFMLTIVSLFVTVIVITPDVVYFLWLHFTGHYSSSVNLMCYLFQKYFPDHYMWTAIMEIKMAMSRFTHLYSAPCQWRFVLDALTSSHVHVVEWWVQSVSWQDARQLHASYVEGIHCVGNRLQQDTSESFYRAKSQTTRVSSQRVKRAKNWNEQTISHLPFPFALIFLVSKPKRVGVIMHFNYY